MGWKRVDVVDMAENVSIFVAGRRNVFKREERGEKKGDKDCMAKRKR